MSKNLRTVKLIKVDAKNNNNKFYHLTEKSNGTFLAEFGRVEGGQQSKVYPIDKWDGVLRKKLKGRNGEPPYKDVTHLFVEEEDKAADPKTDKSMTSSIQNKVVQRLVTQLQDFAGDSVQRNYSISSQKVTQAMVDEAQGIVDLVMPMIKTAKDVSSINKQLQELYMVIPRKMSNVKNHLIHSFAHKDDLTDAMKLISNEQDTLDVMAGQVALNTGKSKSKSTSAQSDSILDVFGLEIEPGTNEDFAAVQRLMEENSHRLQKVYRVINHNTQTSFDDCLGGAQDKKLMQFWHGSRNQNWLNILKTGLMIRPTCAAHSGSMFGDGIYGADRAQKSMGYTSLRNSYWAGGNSSTAFLGVFSFHVGRQKIFTDHNHNCYSLNEQALRNEGFDSVYAKKGYGFLMNNEYIVYNSSRVTVEYLVEIG